MRAASTIGRSTLRPGRRTRPKGCSARLRWTRRDRHPTAAVPRRRYRGLGARPIVAARSWGEADRDALLRGRVARPVRPALRPGGARMAGRENGPADPTARVRVAVVAVAAVADTGGRIAGQLARRPGLGRGRAGAFRTARRRAAARRVARRRTRGSDLTVGDGDALAAGRVVEHDRTH